MREFKIPTKEEVTQNNQNIFDNLESSLGFVPNLYAYYAKNETALSDYLALQNRKATLSKKEREVVNLVVSQYNGCEYCLSAHTLIGGLNGFSKEEILDIRSNNISFDEKLAALAQFTSAVLNSKGNISENEKENFFNAGYTEANMIDIVINIGDKVISNYIHNITKFAIDFPLAPSLEQVTSA